MAKTLSGLGAEVIAISRTKADLDALTAEVRLNRWLCSFASAVLFFSIVWYYLILVLSVLDSRNYPVVH